MRERSAAADRPSTGTSTPAVAPPHSHPAASCAGRRGEEERHGQPWRRAGAPLRLHQAASRPPSSVRPAPHLTGEPAMPRAFPCPLFPRRLRGEVSWGGRTRAWRRPPPRAPEIGKRRQRRARSRSRLGAARKPLRRRADPVPPPPHARS
ncbi:unnamed protein product [Urochloa humidicola]